MAINSKESKAMPIPNYKVVKNTEIEDAVMAQENPNAPATRLLDKIENNPYTIQTQVGDVTRSIPSLNKGIQQVSEVSVRADITIPDMFPNNIDYIKSLDYSAGNLSASARRALTDYYTLVMQLMNDNISVNDYYAKMPTLIENIKGLVLTETDWENLRDAIIRTQNYIVHFLWTDMQNISKAMDDGFALYQKSINTWIDEANKYYASTDFIPQDTIKLNQLSKTIDAATGKDEIAQNMWDSMNSMGTRISSAKGEQPPKLQYKQAGVVNEKDFPQNKGLVWIELV